MTIKEFRIFITYLVLVGFIVLGLYLDQTSSESITDKVQAICSFLSLGVSLVAIVYVYKTYKSQKDDTEFNRILDITYRQLEMSIPKMHDGIYRQLNNWYYDIPRDDAERESIIDSYHIEIASFISGVLQHINFFETIITDNNLNQSQRDYLRKMIVTNIGYDFFGTVKWYLSVDLRINGKRYVVNQERLNIILLFKGNTEEDEDAQY